MSRTKIAGAKSKIYTLQPEHKARFAAQDYALRRRADYERHAA